MNYRSRLSKRMGLGGLAAVAAAAMVLGACGSSTPTTTSPQQAVSSAFTALGSQSGIDLHISLGVTSKELQQMAAQGGSGRLSATAANDIAAGSIVVDLNTGNGTPLNNQTSSDRSQQFGLAVQVPPAAGANSAQAADPVELRYVDQTFYLRANLPTLLRDLGQSPSSAAGFQRAAQGADQYVPGLAALGQGNWVSVPASELTGLLQGLQAQVPGAAGTSSPSTTGQMWSQLHAAFTANTRFAQVGTSGGRTHYTASVAVKPFVRDVEQSLPASLGSIPGASSVDKQITRAIGQIPAGQKLVADVWVKDNKVQELDIDLNQFKHKFNFAVPLRIQIGSGTQVLAPVGATPLNLSNLGNVVGGMLGKSSST
jgi:hypothetical protein